MPQTILVPLDGSETALATLRWAVNTFPGAAFQLLHVVNKPSPTTVVETYQIEEANAALAAGKAIIEGANATVAASDYVEAGPVEGIVAYATEKKPDLLLLGSHGRTGLAKAVMGSVSEKVFAQSPIPAVIYKNLG